MGEQKQINLSIGEDVLLITPHGEIRIKIDERGSNVWVWDDDKWDGIPKPELIDIRGEQVLFCVLTHRKVVNDTKEGGGG